MGAFCEAVACEFGRLRELGLVQRRGTALLIADLT